MYKTVANTLEINNENINEKSLLRFYKQHATEALIPYWSRARDTKYGGVYTCFNNAGDRLVSRDKYTWSQGRFLWLWSRITKMIALGQLSGNAKEYYDHLHQTAQFIEENVFLENGNCAFLLTESGEKKESIPGKGFDTSFYADCFVAIGLAEYAGLMNDVQRFEMALNLYNRIRKRISTGNIRSEPYPIPEGYRSHSVPMIMLNVAQELAEVALALNHDKSEELHQHSMLYMKDIMHDFYQDDHRIVEMLPENHSGHDALLYRHINPGHAIESMWFVMHTARKVNDSENIRKAALAIEQAIKIGWDSKYGGLLRFVDISGKKPRGTMNTGVQEKMIANTWNLKLWWPHSEALYATLLASELTGTRTMRVLHEKIHEYVFKTFPNPDQKVGEWIQIRNRQGNPVDQIAALPVKDPYHILRSMVLIIDLLEENSVRNAADN